MNWNFDFNPATGNLNSRSDVLKGLSESFTYDKLDRLTTGVDYLSNGNIQTKADVGNYDYSSLMPHAILQINNPTPELQNLPQQDMTYTSFHKADKITEANFEVQFTYGNDYQRKLSELKNNGNTERTIIYVGDYEKITDANNNIYEVHYIAGSDGLAALAVKQNGGQEQLYYVHTDHLGSILALYDASGQKIYETNFDAWGRERNPNDWTYTPNPNTKPEWLIRGFTGHEHHPEFVLINMNGRMYDPVIGRMLSPDNFVQAADFTQTFNRYSYAFNNPLIYTDPDGEFIGIAFWSMAFVGHSIVNIATGRGDVFGNAFQSANQAAYEMSNAFRFNVYSDANTNVSLGLDPFAAGVSLRYETQESDVGGSVTLGIGATGPFAYARVSYTTPKGLYSC